jgi:hypothetical protein
MTVCVSEKIEEQARKLAKANKKAESNIKEVYWFPAKKQIRLIEIDPTTISSSHITPFYFQPDPSVGIDFWCAISTIRPEEKQKLKPPKGWGSWKDAKKI